MLGWGELCKIPYKGVEQKGGEGNKDFEKGGSWVKGCVP